MEQNTSRLKRQKKSLLRIRKSDGEEKKNKRKRCGATVHGYIPMSLNESDNSSVSDSTKESQL